MSFYLNCILLKNCPYSNNAKLLLQKYNLPCRLIIISHDLKDIYKTDLIQTFPQIYLKRRHHTGSLLLGGYNDLNNIINNCINNNNIKNIKLLKLKEWSDYAIKCLLKLIKKNIL